MNSAINKTALKQIASHRRNLDLKYRFKGLGYERCAELPWVIEHLRPRFGERLRYLDIGTGESPLPSFLSAHTNWEISCLDKYKWVEKQRQFSYKMMRRRCAAKPISVILADLLEAPFPMGCFDLITCISVIEHFEGVSDSTAMGVIASLLRPRGKLVLTTLMNEGHFTEFYVKKEVYGTSFQSEPVYYQRHYDVRSVDERLIAPSGLMEKQRTYFGDYGFQCFEKVMQKPKPLRATYSWSAASLAKRCMSYRSYPVSRVDMRMNTASGVILVLEKPACAA